MQQTYCVDTGTPCCHFKNIFWNQSQEIGTRLDKILGNLPVLYKRYRNLLQKFNFTEWSCVESKKSEGVEIL